MAATAIEDRISELWDKAVDLGRKQKLKAMLDAWLRVRQFDDQHRVLDDRERARMLLFLGNSFLVNEEYQSASDQYAQAARCYLGQDIVEESSVQWVEETLEKWGIALTRSREAREPVQFDQSLYNRFRQIVPSFRVRQHVSGKYKITVLARYRHWVIRFEQEENSWEFHGETFEKALGKVKRGARADFLSGEWGPNTDSFPPFPG